MSTLSKTTSNKTRLRRLWDGVSMIFRSRVATIGLAIILVWVFVAIFAQVIAPHDPLAQDSSAINQTPSEKYPLGTDHMGRDMLSRMDEPVKPTSNVVAE